MIKFPLSSSKKHSSFSGGKLFSFDLNKKTFSSEALQKGFTSIHNTQSNFGSLDSDNIREIPSAPFKILDAPGLQDDYYLNVLDWINTDKVVVALGHTIYKWCPKEGQASKLMSIPHDENLSSLKGNYDGTKLSLGYDTGLVKIFDIETQKIERTMKG